MRKTLAFPTPTFDAITVLQGPGHRPIGRGSSLQVQAQPNDPTAPSCVNKKAYNSRGYTGTRADKFIQDNQFLPVERKPGVYPLSSPGTEGLGNVGDEAPQRRPTFAEPKNGEMMKVLNILNTKGNAYTGENLSSGQLRLIAERRDKFTAKNETHSDTGAQVMSDFADTRRVMMKDQRIRNAMSQGFSREEAEIAYKALRDREAEVALNTQQSVSARFADLIDSRLGGTQNGAVPGNDESAIYLAYAGGKQELRTVKELLFTAARSKGIREQQAATTIQSAVRAAFNKPPEQGLATAIQEAVAKRRGRPPGAADKTPRIRPAGLRYRKGGSNAAAGAGGGGGAI